MAVQKFRKGIIFLLIPFLFAIAPVAITGCGGGGGGSSSAPGNPNIALSQSDTNFGAVVLDNFSDKQLSIRNTGTGNLTIGQIAQNDPLNAPFSITSDGCSGTTVAPSSQCGLIIRFAPTGQAVYSDSIDIPSNDNVQGTLTATMLGSGKSLKVSVASVGRQGQTITVVASVTDKNNTPITSLVLGEFLLSENGTPQTIDTVSNIVQTPVSVGLVLDYSGSMISFTNDMVTAAKSFIDQMDPVNDEAEIIRFSGTIEITEQFTTDKNALKAALDLSFPYNRFETRLYDALDVSIGRTAARSKRLAIVAVSDGKDENFSAATLDDVISNAIVNDVAIYTIGIGNVDNVVMQQIAADTGGQFFFAPSSSDLAGIYTQISEILSDQYSIVYTTTSQSGSTITIKVEVDDNGQLGEFSKTVTL